MIPSAALLALAVQLCAAAQPAVEPLSWTLADVGVAQRVDLKNERNSSPYLFPNFRPRDGQSPAMVFSPACNPFEAQALVDNGEAQAVCFVGGDRRKPLVLGLWNPKEYVEVADALAGDGIVWRYWKVRFDEEIVSLSRKDDDNYAFLVRLPGETRPQDSFPVKGEFRNR